MLIKILKITAATVFMVALAVNTTVSYNDPFEMISLNAIATGTDTTSMGGTGNETDTTTTTTLMPGNYTVNTGYVCQKTNGVKTYEKKWQACDPGGLYACEPYCKERWARNGGGIPDDWVDCQ